MEREMGERVINRGERERGRRDKKRSREQGRRGREIRGGKERGEEGRWGRIERERIPGDRASVREKKARSPNGNVLRK